MRQETNDVFQETLNSYSCTLHGLIRDAVIVTTCMTKKEITKKPASFPWSCHLWNSHLERLRKKGSGGKMIFKMTISFVSFGIFTTQVSGRGEVEKKSPPNQKLRSQIAFGPWKSPSLEPTVHRCYRMVPCANLQLPPEVDKCELNLTDCQGGGRNIGFWKASYFGIYDTFMGPKSLKSCVFTKDVSSKRPSIDWEASNLSCFSGALVATGC